MISSGSRVLRLDDPPADSKMKVLEKSAHPYLKTATFDVAQCRGIEALVDLKELTRL